MKVRIIIELDPKVPLDYLNDWVKDLRKMRFVKDAYIEKKEDWEQ